MVWIVNYMVYYGNLFQMAAGMGTYITSHFDDHIITEVKTFAHVTL